MRHGKTLASFAAMLLCLCLLAPACLPRTQVPGSGSNASRAPEKGQVSPEVPARITMGVLGRETVYGPFGGTYGSDIIERLVYSGLTHLDTNGLPVPDIASDWEVSEDALTYKFRLRSGALWADGTPVTAEDVVFTYGTLTRDTCPLPAADKWAKRTVTQIGNTVIIELRAPDPDLLNDCSMPVLPKAVFGPLSPQDWPLIKTRDDRPLEGSGPFTLKARTDEKSVTKLVFVRSARYWAGAAKVAELEIRFYDSPGDFVAAVDSGALDVALATQAPAGLKTANPTVSGTVIPDPSFVSLVFNCGKRGKLMSPFDDAVTRMAVGRLAQGAVNDLNDQVIIPLRSILTVFGGIPFKEGARETFEQASQVVQTQLKQAGWDKPAGKWRRRGRVFTFQLAVPNTDEERLRVARVIADKLADFGFDVKLIVEEGQVFVLRSDPPFDYDAMILGWIMPDFDDLSELLRSSAVPFLDWTIIKVSGGQNIMQYRNKSMDTALDAFRNASSQETKLRAATELDRIIAADWPFAPLYSHRTLFLINKRVELGALVRSDIFYNVTRWTVNSK